MFPDHIDQIRRFNRFVTQRIGALSDRFLDRDRPLGQARLLYEIGRDGAEIRTLRARLGLDSGYLSRLLRALERQGLVTAGPAEDGRVRRVALTPAGLDEVAEYDRRAESFAHAVLAPLAARQRDRLAAAMAEVERLLGASAVEIAPEPAGSAAARFCLEAYFRELGQRFRAGFDPDLSISATIDELTPPSGVLLLARLGGRPVGCGALKVKPDGIGEVKRMWVAPEARGIGLGRRLLDALECQARGFGLTRLRLETNESLAEAQALYRSAGYAEIAPFNDEPYAHHWFEKPIR